jgi:hypothetical protein
MSSSNTALADRCSRNGAIIMTLGAFVLVATCLLNLTDDRIGITPLRASTWGFMILLWLIVLATGGGLLLSRPLRAIINDELTLQHRGRAIQAGFWVAMAATLTVYALSFVYPLSVRQALSLVATVPIAAALLRFAWLELR